MTTDDDRIAYLEGEDRSGLDPEERRALDGIRVLLADPSLWEEPPAGLEADVVAAIRAGRRRDDRGESRAPGDRPPPRPRGRRRGARRARGGNRRVASVAEPRLLGPALRDGLEPDSARTHRPGTASLTKTDSGWRIVLHATGLTRLDNGRYYQAWLKNAAGTLVPIGTFNDGRNVTLWAGVSPVDYPTLTITIEAADGNQASSGRRVLVGTITR